MRLACIFRKLLRDEEGATMVEYALMTAFIALICIASVVILGGNTLNLFTANGNAIIQALSS